MNHSAHRDRKLQNDQPGNAVKRITWVRFGKLWKLLGKHGFLPGMSARKKTTIDRQAARRPGKTPVWLHILSGIPWLLCLLFLFSFYWDFIGMELSLFETSYPLEGLLRIISISGLIGFLTNWIAITMLFRPARRRPLLGHGLVPAQKERVAWHLATAVSRDLINPEIINAKIRESGLITRYRVVATQHVKGLVDSPAFRSDLKSWVTGYLQELLQNRQIRSAVSGKVLTEIDAAIEKRPLEKAAFRTYRYLKGDEIRDIIEGSLLRLSAAVDKEWVRMDELLDRFPQTLSNRGDEIETAVTHMLHRLVNKLDVYSLVEENLKNYDEGRLETMIKGATNEQLRTIKYLGAALGTVGGLVIWQPLLSLIIIGLLLSSVLAADHLLMRATSATDRTR